MKFVATIEKQDGSSARTVEFESAHDARSSLVIEVNEQFVEPGERVQLVKARHFAETTWGDQHDRDMDEMLANIVRVA